MPNTESEVIQTILKRGGKAKKGDVVKELGISLGYLDIITRSLERRGLVKFSNGVYFLTSSGKKKLAEFIPKKLKKLESKTQSLSQSRVEGRKRGRPRKQKEEQKLSQVLLSNSESLSNDDHNEPEIKLTEQTEEPPKKLEESPVETLLGQQVDELKEKVTEAKEKIEEGVKEIEEKIETVKETVGPVVGKVEELPPIILQFGKFLLSTSKKVLDKCKKVKNVKFPKSRVLLAQQDVGGEKQVPRISLVVAKLRNFKMRDKLVFLPIWISKNYKNLTRKKN